MMGHLDRIAAENPDFIKLTEEGTTHEGRRLVMLKIGTSPKGSDTRAVWIDAGESWKSLEWERSDCYMK